MSVKFQFGKSSFNDRTTDLLFVIASSLPTQNPGSALNWSTSLVHGGRPLQLDSNIEKSADSSNQNRTALYTERPRNATFARHDRSSFQSLGAEGLNRDGSYYMGPPPMVSTVKRSPVVCESLPLETVRRETVRRNISEKQNFRSAEESLEEEDLSLPRTNDRRQLRSGFPTMKQRRFLLADQDLFSQGISAQVLCGLEFLNDIPPSSNEETLTPKGVRYGTRSPAHRERSSDSLEAVINERINLSPQCSEPNSDSDLVDFESVFAVPQDMRPRSVNDLTTRAVNSWVTNEQIAKGFFTKHALSNSLNDLADYAYRQQVPAPGALAGRRNLSWLSSQRSLPLPESSFVGELNSLDLSCQSSDIRTDLDLSENLTLIEDADSSPFAGDYHHEEGESSSWPAFAQRARRPFRLLPSSSSAK